MNISAYILCNANRLCHAYILELLYTMYVRKYITGISAYGAMCPLQVQSVNQP